VIAVEDRDGIAVVRIDRPPANAMDHELLAAGAAVAERLRADAPRAVVITGREGFFSAGLDLKLAPTLDAAGQERMVTAINDLFAAWYALPHPVVAAVNGHAIAGGLILALCADYRVAGEQGKFGLTELRAGLPFPAVALAVVRAELDPRAARRLVLGADLADARAMHELGVFDELAADPVDRALAAAARLAELPGGAYGIVKAQLRGHVLAAALAGADPAASGWVGDETRNAAAAVLRDDG
jgi:enoyl-CoA hydratase